MQEISFTPLKLQNIYIVFLLEYFHKISALNRSGEIYLGSVKWMNLSSYEKESNMKLLYIKISPSCNTVVLRCNSYIQSYYCTEQVVQRNSNNLPFHFTLTEHDKRLEICFMLKKSATMSFNLLTWKSNYLNDRTVFKLTTLCKI